MTIALRKNDRREVGGLIFQQNKSLTAADQTILINEELAAAKTGTLSTRTDNNTGILTMAGGHGITTGARLDLYWNGGSRRGIVVGTVSGNSVPIDLGAGDNLPVVTTAITAMVPLQKDFAFSGDDLKYLLFGSQAKSQFVVADTDVLELMRRYISVDTNNNGSYNWDTDSGDTNPLAGAEAVSLFLSHGDSDSSRVLQAAAGLP